MDLPFNRILFKVNGGVMAGHVNSAVKHSVGAWPCFSLSLPRCLSELSAAVFVVSSLSLLYLANSVTKTDSQGLCKYERGTKLLCSSQAASVPCNHIHGSADASCGHLSVLSQRPSAPSSEC